MAKKSPTPDLSGLSHEEKDTLILSLFARLAALESKVNKTSQNSSKPPSSDGLVKKTSSLRESSGKPPGGQAGHKGTTLKRVAEPTQTVDHPLPPQCLCCHSALPLAQAEVAERRQMIDIPSTVFDVIEHRTLAVTCSCVQAHVSSFPAAVTDTVQYGPNVRAFGVHLTQGQMLPYARAAELIFDVDGLAISPTTLLAWVAEASAALQATTNRIADQLWAAPVLNADESGLRVAGKL